ncbi:MAG: hypothetical protein IJY58_03390 [Alphaproteobacteria bacterium]|nr:hypothetical protein [Alphaproteobacteria bacterium]
MKKIIINAFFLFIALLSGVSLFVLKYQVKAEERHLHQIHREILQNKREIHMLEAEWAYFNSPARLKELVKTQTNWAMIEPEQLVTLTDIPMRPREDEGLVEVIETEDDKLNKEKEQKKSKSTQKEFLSVSKKMSVKAKPNLDSLAQSAKSVSQKSDETKSRLKGHSQADYVWSNKDKKGRKDP